MLASLPHAKASPVQDSVYLYAPKHLLWRQEAEADGLSKLPVAAADLVAFAPSRIAHEEALRQVCEQTGTGRFACAPWTRLMHLLRGGPHSQTLSVLLFQGSVAGPPHAYQGALDSRALRKQAHSGQAIRSFSPQAICSLHQTLNPTWRLAAVAVPHKSLPHAGARLPVVVLLRRHECRHRHVELRQIEQARCHRID